jgi:hypothetical protein
MHARLCSQSILNVMEKIVMHVMDSRSEHKDVKVINFANHPLSSVKLECAKCHISKIGNFLVLQARGFKLLTSKHDMNL